MRVLYVLPYVPSPIRVRPYQLIRYLAKIGHRITVVALEDGFADFAARRELEAVCDAVHIVPHAKSRAAITCLAALPTPQPLWTAWARSPAMSLLLRELSVSGRFDIAHIEHLRAARFAADLGKLPAIIDAVDCITELRRQMAAQTEGTVVNRLLSWEEWIKLRRWEPCAYQNFRRIAVTSAFDAEALASLDARLPPISVITNGVDTDYFRPDTDAESEPDRIVFSGKMSFYANDDAARHLLSDILPRLRALRPAVRLSIVGSRPSARLRTLAARAGGLEVTGQVGDMRPHLARAAIAVCPLRIAVGVQNKALEAMAMERPVICTPIAAKGFSPEAAACGAIRIAETPDAFAAACARLLADPDAARESGILARTYVESFHRWETAAAAFSRLYEGAIG